MNQFNEKAGATISRSEARKMTSAFQSKFPDLTRAYYFSADQIKKVLSTPGCVGIRTYHGLDNNGSMVHILVPVSSNGNPMLPKSLEGTDDSSIVERGQPCPPYCPDEDI